MNTAKVQLTFHTDNQGEAWLVEALRELPHAMRRILLLKLLTPFLREATSATSVLKKMEEMVLGVEPCSLLQSKLATSVAIPAEITKMATEVASPDHDVDYPLPVRRHVSNPNGSLLRGSK